MLLFLLSRARLFMPSIPGAMKLKPCAPMGGVEGGVSFSWLLQAANEGASPGCGEWYRGRGEGIDEENELVLVTWIRKLSGRGAISRRTVRR